MRTAAPKGSKRMDRVRSSGEVYERTGHAFFDEKYDLLRHQDQRYAQEDVLLREMRQRAC